jgi:serine/threonine-protein kinase RsbT
VAAREKGRELSAKLGFSSIDLTLIVTAISEVARNILLYANEGEIVLRLDHHNGLDGIVVVARDEGPGIADLDLAMRDSYSTGSGLGLGLPGARRLMDEFEIESEVSKGTTIVMKKWAPERV